MTTPHRLVAVLTLAATVPCAGPADAQTNLETNAGIQFNFSTPGASSLGRGGAFLALADDATAAYTNPAGLTSLFRPELSIEVRGARYTHVFTDRGRVEGRNISDLGLDTVEGLRDGEAEDQVLGLSFLSYAANPRENVGFTAYRHELVNFEASFITQGAYLYETRGRDPSGIPGALDGRLASLSNEMTLDIVTYGLSGAYRFGPSLSIGAGLAYFEFSLDSRTDRFVPPLLEAATFGAEDVVNFQTQRGEDSGWGLRGGFLWRVRGGPLSVAGVFRQGVEFELAAKSLRGPGASLRFKESEKTASFSVPDVWGLGLAFELRAGGRLTFDYYRVEYSDLVDGFTDIFDLPTLFNGLDPELAEFRIDDADELRFGFEQAVREKIFLRLGAWYDPDHSLRFEGENLGFRAMFRPGSGEMHYSLGVGMSAGKLELNAAVDVSKRVSTAALSTIIRF